MNEEIKQIAITAQLEHCVSHVRLQHFAELLIQKTIHEMCCQIHKHGIDQSNNPAFYKAIIGTELHFGIENIPTSC